MDQGAEATGGKNQYPCTCSAEHLWHLKVACFELESKKDATTDAADQLQLSYTGGGAYGGSLAFSRMSSPIAPQSRLPRPAGPNHLLMQCHPRQLIVEMSAGQQWGYVA